MTNVIAIFKKRKKVYLISLVSLIFIIIISKFVFNTFSQLTPVKSIYITSENLDFNAQDPGSFLVTKSAKWKNKWNAEVTYDINSVIKTNGAIYRDVILVLSTSNFVDTSKLDSLKNGVSNLVDTILEDTGNKVALVYNNNLLSDLSNDKDSLNLKVNALVTNTGHNNYYQALKKVETILESYEKVVNRDLVVLFVTNGYSNKDTPNQITEYNYLKDAYNYITINGVQYEMGDSANNAIIEVSDNQYTSNSDNIDDILYKASYATIDYEVFNITDDINSEYFEVVSANATVGDVSTVDNQVIWNANNRLVPANNEQLVITLSLKNEYQNIGGIYPVSTNTQLVSSISGIEENIETTNTPILSDKYLVTYDGNAPSGCNVSNVPSNQDYFVFDNVQISNNTPVCNGYQFKTWKVVNDNVEVINNDYFKMPEDNVIVRAEWAKLTLNKSADGTVHKVQTLYSLIKEQAVMDNIRSEYVDNNNNAIQFGIVASTTNGMGVYERAGTENDDYPIYYFRGYAKDENNKEWLMNNVIFANTCFKIVRTTDTGGVKMIYNGVPTNGTCDNTGTASQLTGTKAFNSNDRSVADAGYMYGTRYLYQNRYNSYLGPNNWYRLINKTTTSQAVFTSTSGMSNKSYYYADKATWNGTEYVLENNLDEDNNPVDVIKYTWSSNYNNLKGKYTCMSDNETTGKTCTSVYYIVGGNSSTAYHIQISSGNNLNDYRIYVSNDIEWKDASSEYELKNPIDVTDTWFTNYSTYVRSGYYFCNTFTDTICSNVKYISGASSFNVWTIEMSNNETYESLYEEASQVEWLFGNDVDENGDLVDTIPVKPLEWTTEYNTLNNNHYTCFSTSSTCTGSNVFYVYYTDKTSANYISIAKGKDVNDALSEMLDYNDNSSTVKGAATPASGTVDWWYENTILNTKYEDLLEDTVYCNNRGISHLNGWNPDGGNITDVLYFSSNTTPDLVCERQGDLRNTVDKKIDKFTKNSTIGNGALRYPVGLLSVDEAKLSGNANGGSNKYLYLATGSNWWLGSPRSFYKGYSVRGYYMNSGSYYTDNSINSAFGVRPVISLKPGVKVDGGDGSMGNPYTIEME